MTLGYKLHELRKTKNLSQLEISNIFDVTQNAYHKWETNKSKPSIENLAKIADFYETDIYSLLEEVSNINMGNSKLKGNNAIGSQNQNNFYNTSKEIIEHVLSNQDSIIKLIDIQNDLLAHLVEKK